MTRHGRVPRWARRLFPVFGAILALSAGLMTPSPVQAFTRTWDGGGAPLDTNWSTPANWSADTLPVPGDTVIFNGTSTKNATIDGAVVTVAIFQMNALYTGTVNQGAGNVLTLTTSFTQSAGTFTGGSSAITVGGAFTVNAGGAFTSTSGTLTLSGAVTLAAGVFTHNSGSVVFSTNNVTLNLGGAATFNNVEFLSGTKTITALNTMTVLGTLSLTGGAVNTGTIAAKGNINARIGFTGGSATLLINGGGDQLFDGDHTSLIGALPNVNINKLSGVLTLTDILRTGRNWTHTATPVDGLVVTGSTLVFTGVPGTTITGSHTLSGVEMRGGTVTIAAGTTLTATGTLELFSGTVATGTLAAQGNINARIGFTGGSATLLINGTGPQQLDGDHDSATGGLPNVNINKLSGVLTLVDILRTGRNWTHTATPLDGLVVIGSTVIFTDIPGTIITGSHTLGGVEMRGGTVTITTGTTLTATDTLELFSGTVVTGTLAAQGDIFARSGFAGGSGTLLINGTGVGGQLWTGEAIATSNLPVVNINKTSGGPLTMTGTFRTTRNWTWTAGTVSASGSTVIFAAGLIITGSHTLGGVEMRGGTVTITTGTTLTATDTLELFSGTVVTGTLAAQGDIFARSGFAGGSGTLLINGTGVGGQLWTGEAIATSNLPVVNINKTSGGPLTMTGTFRTTRNWTWTAGTVSASGSTVIFAGTLVIDAAGMTFADVLVNAGTATLAANLTATGDLTVAAGTLDIGSNTVFVAGDVTVDGGLTVTTGTLDMNGPPGQTLGGAAAIGLYDLTISNLADVTQTTTVSVAGTLNLGGQLTFSGQSLSIANAITGAPNNLAGDATSTLIITGTGSGIIIPVSLVALLNLSIDNPNGAALAGPLTVEGTFTLAGGNLDAGSTVLTIGPAGSVVRTSGHVIGALEKSVPVGSPVNLTFEIGDATTYAPISLTFGTVYITGTLTASTTPGEHPSIGTSNIDPAQDVNRWWSLTNAGVNFDTLDATFTFSPADLDAGAQPAAFIVAKWDGSWTLPIAGGQTATTITAYDMTSLSEFAVGEAAADLSVALSASASSIVLGSSVHLTATITNDGPSDATGVQVTITPPAGSSFSAITPSQGSCLVVLGTIVCDLGSLASGAGATVEFDDSPATVGTATTTAAVSGDQSDPLGGNDSDALDVEVLPAADLSDVAVSTGTPRGIGPAPLLLSATLLVLLALAGVIARGNARGASWPQGRPSRRATPRPGPSPRPPARP